MAEEFKEKTVVDEKLDEVSGGAYWTGVTGQVGGYRCRQWVVQPGDCLSVIGQQTGCNWQLIAQLNGVPGPKYVIRAGQYLWIPY